jgi:hypothetical protein
LVYVTDNERYLFDFISEVVKGLQALRHKISPKKKVHGRVADQRHFWGNDKLSSFLNAFAICSENTFSVAGEIPYNSVNLSDTYLHMNGKKNEQLSSADVNEDAQKLEVFAMDTLQEDDCQLPEPEFACF